MKLMISTNQKHVFPSYSVPVCALPYNNAYADTNKLPLFHCLEAVQSWIIKSFLDGRF